MQTTEDEVQYSVDVTIGSTQASTNVEILTVAKRTFQYFGPEEYFAMQDANPDGIEIYGQMYGVPSPTLPVVVKLGENVINGTTVDNGPGLVSSVLGILQRQKWVDTYTLSCILFRKVLYQINRLCVPWTL